jgi:hypothetical protein
MLLQILTLNIRPVVFDGTISPCLTQISTWNFNDHGLSEDNVTDPGLTLEVVLQVFYLQYSASILEELQTLKTKRRLPQRYPSYVAVM